MKLNIIFFFLTFEVLYVLFYKRGFIFMLYFDFCRRNAETSHAKFEATFEGSSART